MFKKIGIGLVCSAFALTSVFGGAGSSFAAENSTMEDIEKHHKEMTFDTKITVSDFVDTNDSGLIDKGDVVELNVNVKNTSAFDYTNVNLSSHKLKLDREKVSSDLKSGETGNYKVNYSVSENDNISNTIDGNIWVNVRDSQRVEKSIDESFNIQSNGSEESNADDCDLYDDDSESIDGCFKELDSVSNNSKTNSLPILLDKKTNTIVSEKGNKATIEKLAPLMNAASKVVSESKMDDYYKVGNEVVSYVNFNNNSNSAIELDKVQLSLSEVKSSNVKNMTVDSKTKKDLYFTRTINKDDLIFGISDTMVESENSNIIVKSNTGRNYVIEDSESFPYFSTSISMETDGEWTKDKDNNSVVEFYYTFSNDGFDEFTVDSIVSKDNGTIMVDKKVIDNKLVVKVPEKETVKGEGSVSEEGYAIYYGKYFTDSFVAGSSFSDTVGGETGAGVGDVIKKPTMTVPECDNEARVVIPDPYDDYYYESSRDGNKVKVQIFYKMGDGDDDLLTKTWNFTIPAIVDCPTDPPVDPPTETPDEPKKKDPTPPIEVIPPKVKRVKPEAPTYTPETCDVSESVEIPSVKGIKYTVDKKKDTISVVAYDSVGRAGFWNFDKVEFDKDSCVVKKVKTGEVSVSDNSNNVLFVSLIGFGFAVLLIGGVYTLSRVREVK